VSERRLDALYRPFPPFSEWAGTDVNEQLWDESLAILRERRARSSETAFGEMVERALRAAAVDTGAIEGLYSVDRGFTMSVVEVVAPWESAVEAQKGRDVAALVQAQRRGYDLALDAAMSGIEISEAWIRRVHEETCGPQDAFAAQTPLGPQAQQLPKGVYKRQPNHVLQPDGSVHAYAPVDASPGEMHRLVTELRGEDFDLAHPVLQAAFAHYAFTAVHPFADGNGRVARVLASVYLLRAVSVPLVVFADQRDLYLKALRAADEGRLSTFVGFVAERAVDAILDIAEELPALSQPTVEESVAQLTRATTSRSGVAYAEVSVIGKRLTDQVRAALTASMEQLSPPVVGALSHGMAHVDPPSGYRNLSDGSPYSVATVSFEVSGRLQTRVEVSFDAAVADDLDRAFPFLIMRVQPYEALQVRLEEVYPLITDAFRRRLSAWADRMVREGLADLAERVESQVQPQ
jgi:Fic family protein